MKQSRNLWPYGILAAFFLFFCGLITVIAIAVTHRDSLVSEKYYDQELAFQNQINSTDRAQKAGAAISRDSANGNIIVALPASQTSQNVSGTIELYRPSDPKLDQELQLKPEADGTQTLDASKLTTGLWQVRARWNAGGQDYYLQQKITVAGR